MSSLDAVKIIYTSTPVPIPDTFLAPFDDPSCMTVAPIDFTKTALPEYANRTAVVIDGVLTPEECTTLIRMAEQSTRSSSESSADSRGGDTSSNGWRPAMVNVGANYELLSPHYRNSDRIIWDDAEVVRRLWDRIIQNKAVWDQFRLLDGTKHASVLGHAAAGERWYITDQGLNERMRFLKYTAGQFFRPHCDATYTSPNGKQRSFFTLHLYLNDSAQELEGQGEGGRKPDGAAGEMLRGGATPFHSYDEKRRLDVNPKAGRVLIFQHRMLLHSGDDVVAGTKYTMRTELMYERF